MLIELGEENGGFQLNAHVAATAFVLRAALPAALHRPRGCGCGWSRSIGGRGAQRVEGSTRALVIRVVNLRFQCMDREKTFKVKRNNRKQSRLGF
jgi:hypothetical protein